MILTEGYVQNLVSYLKSYVNIETKTRKKSREEDYAGSFCLSEARSGHGRWDRKQRRVYLYPRNVVGFLWLRKNRFWIQKKGVNLHSKLIGWIPELYALGASFQSIQKYPWNTQGRAFSSSTLCTRQTRLYSALSFLLRAGLSFVDFNLTPLHQIAPVVAIPPSYSWKTVFRPHAENSQRRI